MVAVEKEHIDNLIGDGCSGKEHIDNLIGVLLIYIF